jgi:transposase
VDYGQGTLPIIPSPGNLKTLFFVMRLRSRRKSFRKVVWNTNQQAWAKLREEAFCYFGGCPQYVVFDLKTGVIKPDPYEPRINPVDLAILAHYGTGWIPSWIRFLFRQKKI